MLLVEDDTSIASVVKELLERKNFYVVHVGTGKACLEVVSQYHFDAIILDVMLPDVNGFEVCRSLRSAGISTPVLMLTVKSEVEDKVIGFESGADDYVTKPFSSEELVARIKALIRRVKDYREVLKVADLEVYPLSRRVLRSGREIELSPKEFEILELLVRNKGKVLGEKYILNKIWKGRGKGVLKVYMHHLRQKIDRDFDKKLIKTVRGVGYMIDVS